MLIIVSNRLPFTVVKKDHSEEFAESSGGLVSAIKSYLGKLNQDYLWVGWPGSPIGIKGQAEVKKKAYTKKVLPVFLSEIQAENFYNGFCNKILWPLFHYFPSYGVFDEKFWQSYKQVNKTFCDEILKVAKADDVIWIHDFQLMLLPAMLREKLPNVKIGFFLHIPFPSYEIFRLLPAVWRNEILEGLLGADLIGFHTLEYSRYFLATVLRVLGYEHSLGTLNINGRIILARSFPLGIDFQRFYKAPQSKSVKKEKSELDKTLKSKKIILSIDRLDYTKGIVNRLNGFEIFLSKYPQWHKKLVMILVMIPSRIDVNQYELMKRQIDELISKINGTYSNIGWTPILYQFSKVPFDRLVALYNKADIALITPLRDGMNLIAKEYVAAQVEKTGVLILSEMAGAARELTEALTINPHSQEEIAESINLALKMPKKEQLQRLKKMQKGLAKHDVFNWAAEFLETLNLVKDEQLHMGQKVLNTQLKKELISHFAKAKKRLIFLDYDGTLVPFKARFWQANPTKPLIGLLRKISENSKNEVVIVSGRDKDTLDKWFNKLPLNLVAEHGLLIKEKWASWKIMNHLSTEWKKDAMLLLSFYTDQLPGSFIEEKEFSIAWHYRLADSLQATVRSKELMDDLVNFTANKNLQILHGDKVIEIKSVYISKGMVGGRWFDRQNFDFILAIGDDKTDEDLFSSLPKHAYSINIGSSISSAKYCLNSYKEVLKLLSELAG